MSEKVEYALLLKTEPFGKVIALLQLPIEDPVVIERVSVLKGTYNALFTRCDLSL